MVDACLFDGFEAQDFFVDVAVPADEFFRQVCCLVICPCAALRTRWKAIACDLIYAVDKELFGFCDEPSVCEGECCFVWCECDEALPDDWSGIDA